MLTNPVKETILAGGTALGTMVLEFGTTGMGRIASAAGADFVIYDMEHSGFTVETIRTLMASSRGTGIVPMVRPSGSLYHLISGPLDMGALGVMVPMVESAKQARQIAQAARYPPVGGRGSAFGFAHDDYLGGTAPEKMQHANNQILMIAQIETAKGLAAVDDIVAVDGVDVIWIGQSDLTAFMGIPGQFDHPDYLAALDRVVDAANQVGKTAGFMATSVDEGEMLLNRGFRMLAYWADVGIYQAALRHGIEGLRNHRKRSINELP